MGNPSNIATSNTVDPPFAFTASYQFDQNDRQFIDNQTRGCEQHLVDSVISGVACTWYKLDGASAALNIGDWFCMASAQTSTVTKCTAAALANAGIVIGVAMVAAAPGASFRGGIGGAVASAVTGLASSAPGPVRVNTTTGRAQQVSALVAADYPIGYVDAAGNLTIARVATGIAGGGGWTNSLLDLNFTTLTSATLTSGATTIGGLACTVANVVNSNSFAIVNGTGLQIQPISTGNHDYDAAACDSPLIRIALGALGIPNLSWTTQLRIWLYFDDTINADAYPSYESTIVGIDGGYLTSTTKAFSRVVGRGVGPLAVQGVFLKASVSGGGQSTATLNLAGGVSGSLFGGATWGAVGSNNVIVAEIDGFNRGHSARFGTYSGGWPSDGALNPAVSYHEASGTGYLEAANINVGSLAAANAGPGALLSLVLVAQNNGGNAGYLTTLKRLRVDYRN